MSDLRAIIFFVGALTIAGLGGLLAISGGEIDRLEAQLSAKEQALASANRQAQKLSIAQKIGELQLDNARRQIAAGDDAVAHAHAVAGNLSSTLQPVKKGPAYASDDDAPAAPVLEHVANSLRNFAEAYAAVRAGDDLVSSDGGTADTARVVAASWPGLKPPFTQAQFGQACLDLGNGLATATGNLRGIARYQDSYNANVRNFNAVAETSAISGVVP